MPERLGVIFDMDGVLVNSFRAHLQSWRRTAQAHGLSMSDEDFRRTFGRTSRDIITNLWPGKFDDEQAKAFDDQKEAAYREILREEFPAMDGASELIQSLHGAGFKLAIGSSGPPANVALVCEMLPSADLFDATVNGSEISRGKPEPDVFLLGATRLGLEPRQCAVVEDAPAGIEAARRAGMTAIAILGTAPREELAE